MVIFETKEGKELAFHLTMLEMIELEHDTPGGFHHRINESVKRLDILEMLTIYRIILEKAYGRYVRCRDGEKMIIKTAEYSNAFVHSNDIVEVMNAIATDSYLAEIITNNITSEKAFRIRRKK